MLALVVGTSLSRSSQNKASAVQPEVVGCVDSFTLNMLDSWGDGWNGNAMTILANGAPVLEDATLGEGSQGTETFSANEASVLTATWTTGSFTSEVSFELVDDSGAIVAGGDFGNTIDYTVPADPACQTGPALHGDPMFKFNGKSTHLWLHENQFQELAGWPSDKGSRVTLEAKAFGRESTGNQWLNQFVLKRDGATVVDATVDEATGALRIAVDEASRATKAAALVQLQRQSPTQAHVSMGGANMTITASRARKFSDAAEASKFSHLNLKFDSKLPFGVTGVFAELAGVVPLSKATEALIRTRGGHASNKSTAMIQNRQGKRGKQGFHESCHCVCPAGTCDTVADKDKPACAACASCYQGTTDPCTPSPPPPAASPGKL